MEKQTQAPFWFLGLAVATAVFHNIFSTIFVVEEPIFMALTIMLVFAFIISVVINMATYSAKGKPKDTWKMAWLGLFGLLGTLGATGLYGLFAFFAFFSLKKK